MNDARAITPFQKFLAALPFLVSVLATVGLFAWATVALLLPRLASTDVKPVTPSELVEGTGEPVAGIYLSATGEAFCFQGELLLGGVPAPEDCESIFQVKQAWDAGNESERVGPWSYKVPAVYFNQEARGWDCSYFGEYVATATAAECLTYAEGVAELWGADTPTFVVKLPTMLLPTSEGYPCLVGADVYGFSLNPIGCDGVYLTELTDVPYRV